MNLLTKFRPGGFGLLLSAIVVSSFATSIFKSAQSTANRSPANVSRAEVPTSEPSATSDDTTVATEDVTKQSAADLTFYQYAIHTEIENLDRLIRAEARQRLDAGVTAEQVNGSLAVLKQQPQTPENTARRLYLLRTLQTLKDGEGLPTVEAVKTPTVEEYQNELTTAE